MTLERLRRAPTLRCIALLVALGASGGGSAQERPLPVPQVPLETAPSAPVDVTELPQEVTPPDANEVKSWWKSVLDEVPAEKQKTARGERGLCGGDKAKDPCGDRANAYETGEGLPLDPLVAAAIYERMCELGRSQACARLAALYMEGRGVRQNFPSAVKLYLAACDSGHVPEACNNLGLIYGSGIGVPRDEEKAQGLFRKACKKGDALACSNVRKQEEGPLRRDAAGLAAETRAALAKLPPTTAASLTPLLRECYVGTAWRCTNEGTQYARGQGRPRDVLAAVALFEQACAHQSLMACKNLAGLLLTGKGLPPDEARATALYTRACEGKLGTACTTLGALGLRANRPAVQVLSLFEQGCALKDRVGCANAGWMHERGRGTPVNLGTAVKSYLQACTAGVGLACRNLAVLYVLGRGVQQDNATAGLRFEQGCTLGDAPACATLGALLLEGAKLPRDLPRSEAMLRRACDAGQSIACVNLGWMFDQGMGPQRDVRQAFALYERACTQQDATGCSYAAFLLRGESAAGLDVTRAEAFAKRACELGAQSHCPTAAVPSSAAPAEAP